MKQFKSSILKKAIMMFTLVTTLLATATIAHAETKTETEYSGSGSEVTQSTGGRSPSGFSNNSTGYRFYFVDSSGKLVTDGSGKTLLKDVVFDNITQSVAATSVYFDKPVLTRFGEATMKVANVPMISNQKVGIPSMPFYNGTDNRKHTYGSDLKKWLTAKINYEGTTQPRINKVMNDIFGNEVMTTVKKNNYYLVIEPITAHYLWTDYKSATVTTVTNTTTTTQHRVEVITFGGKQYKADWTSLVNNYIISKGRGTINSAGKFSWNGTGTNVVGIGDLGDYNRQQAFDDMSNYFIEKIYEETHYKLTTSSSDWGVFSTAFQSSVGAVLGQLNSGCVWHSDLTGENLQIYQSATKTTTTTKKVLPVTQEYSNGGIEGKGEVYINANYGLSGTSAGLHNIEVTEEVGTTFYYTEASDKRVYGTYLEFMIAMGKGGYKGRNTVLATSGGFTQNFLGWCFRDCLYLDSNMLNMKAVSPLGTNDNPDNTQQTTISLLSPTVGGSGNGYSMHMYRVKDYSNNPVNTYDTDTKPTSPAQPEKGTSDKMNNGDITIVKVYADVYRGDDGNIYGVSDKGTYSRGNESNLVIITDEASLTGYKLVQWKDVSGTAKTDLTATLSLR